MPEAIFVHDHHGNAEIQMSTKFHSHALYGLQTLRSEKVVIGKSASGNFLSMVGEVKKSF